MELRKIVLDARYFSGEKKKWMVSIPGINNPNSYAGRKVF